MKSNRAIFGLGIILGCLFASARMASANYINFTTVPPATNPTPDETCLPMGSAIGERWSYCNVAGGLFSFSKVDMARAGPMPIVLRRVYRSEAANVNQSGNVAYPFGNGMNFDYNLFLWSESEATGQGLASVDLILPNGARVFCQCTGSDCTPPPGANDGFQCTATPEPDLLLRDNPVRDQLIELGAHDQGPDALQLCAPLAGRPAPFDYRPLRQ